MNAADRLTVARTELALELETGSAGVTTATAHLAFLLDFVPDKLRKQFLFTCWQEWTRYIGTPRRLALSHQGRQAAVEFATEGIRLPASPAWQRYLGNVMRAFMDRPAEDSAPANFLLFQHAHLTHSALGISRDAEAVAAWALRSVPEPLVHWDEMLNPVAA